MRLYLIRHAQSANNAAIAAAGGSDQAQGRCSDPEITQTGHRQSALLASHLAGPDSEPRQHPFRPVATSSFNLTHVYCSLMTRSILTAEYIAASCDLPLRALPDVFERHGLYEYDDNGHKQGVEGPGREYFEQRFSSLELPASLNNAGWWNQPVEEDPAFVERVDSVVQSVRDNRFGIDDCIALVAHGDFIDQFVNALMGVKRHDHNYSGDWSGNWSFHNTSISRIDFDEQSHTVVYLNRVDHLTPELMTW
ncbi:MAG: histidine phosphatase family protein [Pseudomonadota bacterium]